MVQTQAADRPVFLHDCDLCQFIGTIDGNSGTIDVYHASHDGQNSLILRDGDNPEDNQSMPLPMLHNLAAQGRYMGDLALALAILDGSLT